MIRMGKLRFVLGPRRYLVVWTTHRRPTGSSARASACSPASKAAERPRENCKTDNHPKLVDVPKRKTVGRIAAIECPFRDRTPHTASKSKRLSHSAVKHIKYQIARNNYRPLRHLGMWKRFYRSSDCCAVWVSGSAFEAATEQSICGVYDQALIWNPV